MNKYIKTYDMKKIMMIMVLGALIACLVPATAQNPQDWQSTSSMAGSGSAYGAQVTAVGAAGVTDMASTTETTSPAKAPSGPRRSGFDTGADAGQGPSPIGDAVLPMLLLAAVYAVYSAARVYRRKRRV